MACNDNCCSCHSEKEEHRLHTDTCCCCSHEENSHSEAVSVWLIAVSGVLIAVSFIPAFNGIIKQILLVASTAICAVPVFVSGVKGLLKKDINESLLLVVAVIAALFLGDYFEAAVVSTLFRLGELLEDYASERSRKSIESLFEIISDTANLVEDDGSFRKIDADDIVAGMRIAVLPHEIFPVDGIVVSGESAVDTSALTGESLPVDIEKGSKVSSGFVNGDATVIIEAAAGKEESSAARIARMVEEAAAKKGKTQRAVAKFAKYYTPAVVAAAVVLAVIPSLITGEWREWIQRSLILLVASCPCAVVLSAPLAFFSSMGAAAKKGMIIKGSNYIEILSKADTAVFDKTGTLTTGVLKVGKIYPCDSVSEKLIVETAAKCEHHSSHPIANAITAYAGEIGMNECVDFCETAGGGTSIKTAEGTALCGGERFMKSNSVDISELPKAPVYVALNGKALGAMEIESEIRNDSAETVEKLRQSGIENTFMLTGDTAEQARKVCRKCVIDDFRSNLLPEDKLAELEEIKTKSHGVIYVGDGINDAPVLAAADVGVAMGLGAQAACEAADVILTNSDFSRLADAVYQSKRTMSVLKVNIAFAVAVKLIVMLLGAVGVAPMWSAVFADVGTMIICVLNAARLLKIK